jgi:GTP-binding protein HflX
MRSSRRRNQVPVVALVGYTNSGKSTLLNALSGAEAFAEDKLFATLDPLTRHVQLPGGTEALLVDTVGFIHKLPHDLVDAFRSTLEEALFADLLVHVVDASSIEARSQFDVAEQVLNTLGAAHKKKLVAFNKMDHTPGQEHFLPDPFPWVNISALYGIGLKALEDKIEQELAETVQPVDLVIPYDKGKVMGELHDQCKVLEQCYEEDGIHLKVMLSSDMAQSIKARLE